MCGFIAQLVEHRTGIAEVTGSNPVEALIFFQASSFQLLKLQKFTATITLHFRRLFRWLLLHTYYKIARVLELQQNIEWPFKAKGSWVTLDTPANISV